MCELDYLWLVGEFVSAEMQKFERAYVTQPTTDSFSCSVVASGRRRTGGYTYMITLLRLCAQKQSLSLTSDGGQKGGGGLGGGGVRHREKPHRKLQTTFACAKAMI